MKQGTSLAFLVLPSVKTRASLRIGHCFIFSVLFNGLGGSVIS